jgi:hypothetical protein
MEYPLSANIMKLLPIAIWLALSLPPVANPAVTAHPHHWTEAEANEWGAKQPWMVGANFIASYASNQMEMWQEETFDTVELDRELGWAQALGLNTVRVFLHDLLWLKDSSGLEHRMNQFLRIADKHKIRTIFVLFDSRWNPFPEAGLQRPPRAGVYNSSWAQSPGATALMDPRQTRRLLDYVQNVILNFSNDKRIVAWDLWNEPDNRNFGEYAKIDPSNKIALVEALLPQVFTFARAALPTQPITSGLWSGTDWNDPAKLTAVQKIQLDNSDVLSFHNYDGPAEFEKRIQWLQGYHRPILCTEYLARSHGSTPQAILPVAKKYDVAALAFGFVAGRSQTYLPPDSWDRPYKETPATWYQDLVRFNGKPYSQEEADFIHSIAPSEPPHKGK